MNFEPLLSAAWQVRENAYAPYSGFPVGAAVLDEDGRIFTGCNVENISFGLTLCAERVAVFAAVAAGARRFKALAVVSDSRQPISPCGACRQVLAEFCETLPICTANRAGQQFEACLSHLLPRARAGILGT
jgi:cytidine deaminase